MRTRSKAGVYSMAALALLGLGTLAESASAENVSSTQSGCTVPVNTRQRDIQFPPSVMDFDDEGSDLVLNSYARFTPTRTQTGQSRHRGRAEFNYECFTRQGQFLDLGRKRKKLNRNGGAGVSKRVPANQNCVLFFQETSLTGKQKNPGLTVEAGLSVSVDELGGCVADATTLCFYEDRFVANIDWTDSNNRTGQAAAFPLSDNSGYLYFFDPNNWELLVKVLDGCDFNGHYWVFAAAATDVDYDLTVTDTATGETRNYSSPLGNPAPPITDTSAFATCP